MIRVAFVVLLLLLLTGCASAPDDYCVTPSTRQAGLGVTVAACNSWLIPRQPRRFD